MMTKHKSKNGDDLHLVNWEAAESAIFARQYIIIGGLVLLVLLLYILRLWHLQVLEGEKYRYQSENNRIRLEDIPAPRGIIFDRNGIPLVENRPAYQLQLIREDVQDLDATVREVARLCGRDPQEFFSTIEANRHLPKFVPIRLVADLDRDSLARVEVHMFRLPGVAIKLEPRREYVYNGTAAHLIGYISEITETELGQERYKGYDPGEAIGKFGVEGAFEKYLHGKKGGRQVEVNAVGRRIRLLDEVLPIPGRNLWLTIDLDLQKVAEQALEGLVGSIVALDPRNGEVLAMASKPTFDQEQFIRGITKAEWQALSKDPTHPLLNRCIGAAYPPGSTYKPLMALGALKEGAITLETNFGCPGFLSFAGRKYRCWRDRGHGPVGVERSLIQSCDVFYYQSGLRLGVDRIAHYITQFGLGERTGIGLLGEHPGLIPTSAWKKKATGVPWQKGETLSISIGQGFDLATPLQMALAYATIGNGGSVWQPYVVRRIEAHSDGEIAEIKGRLKRKISFDARHLDAVRRGLLGVVEDDRGTAKQIRDKNYQIAGKTGTAQVVRMAEGINRKMWAKAARLKERDHAWFVAYAPAGDPTIAVCAMVEHGEHGSSTAAPLVKQVIAAHMNKMMAAQQQAAPDR